MTAFEQTDSVASLDLWRVARELGQPRSTLISATKVADQVRTLARDRETLNAQVRDRDQDLRVIERTLATTGVLSRTLQRPVRSLACEGVRSLAAEHQHLVEALDAVIGNTDVGARRRAVQLLSIMRPDGQ